MMSTVPLLCLLLSVPLLSAARTLSERQLSLGLPAMFRLQPTATVLCQPTHCIPITLLQLMVLAIRAPPRLPPPQQLLKRYLQLLFQPAQLSVLFHIPARPTLNRRILSWHMAVG